MGPPESPWRYNKRELVHIVAETIVLCYSSHFYITWQESFPPSRKPAQIMFSVIWKGYELKHVSSLRRGASTHCNLWGYLAGKDRKIMFLYTIMLEMAFFGQSQTVWWLTALITGTDIPPSRDLAHCPVTGTLWRERSRAHVVVQSGRSTKFDQHDITVLCAGVVVRVSNKLGRHNVLFCSLGFIDVMLSQPNFYIWPWRNNGNLKI